MKETKTIYTDGSCHPQNPGPGGYGVVVIDEDGSHQEFSGGYKRTTNNRMELIACIEALKAVDEDAKIILHTDSQYVQLGITDWIKGWKRRGWKNASNKPVKNQDLWVILDELAQNHQVQFKWVKAHDGNKWNEKVDELAFQAAQSGDMKVDDGY
jgi:ribonuclease HI